MATLSTTYQMIAEKYIGTVSGSGVSAKEVYLRIYARYSSQSVQNNKSTVSYKSILYVVGSGSYFYTGSSTTKSLSGTGATAASGDASGNYYLGETLLNEISGTITHNSNGAASVSVTAAWSSTPWGISGSVTGSANLPTIPRASSITSATNIVLGNNCGITWTPASATFQYDIVFSLGDWKRSTGKMSPNTNSSYTYNYYVIPVDKDLLSQMPSSTTGTMKATLYTYNSSGTQVGSPSSKSFTVTIPADIVPTIGTIKLTPQTYKYLIQNKNKLTISVSGCSAGSGSNIKSYTFSGPGISSTTTNTFVTSSGTISNTGTLTYTVQVVDNRGRTASKAETITCYSYASPYFKSFKAYKCNADGTANNNGKYIKCEYALAYSSVDNTNDVTVKIYYKTGSGAETPIDALSDSKNNSGNYILQNINADSSYVVYATIEDNYGGKSSSNKINIFGAKRILNITSDGTGVAFGKMAENKEMLESTYKIKAPGLLSSRGRTTSNIDFTADAEHAGTFETFAAKTLPSMGDGHVAHFHWDLTNGYDSQIFINNRTGAIMSRGCNGGTWADWRTSIDNVNYTSYVSPKPTTLYSSTTGAIGTITLSQSAANFTYLEIFYTDNNGRQGNSVKVYSPNGKYVSLSCIEPSTNNTEPRMYIRSSGWTISDQSMTVGRSDLTNLNRGIYGVLYTSGENCIGAIIANNFIKILRVLGYK